MSVSCSVMANSAIPWTVARQAPLSMEVQSDRILRREGEALMPQEDSRAQQEDSSSFPTRTQPIRIHGHFAFSSKTSQLPCPFHISGLFPLQLVLHSYRP